MARALVIHIGDFKAGSTSIQTYLRDGIEAPNGPSLNYIGDTKHHQALAQAIGAQSPSIEQTRIMDDAARAIINAPEDIAVLSSGHFSQIRPRVLRNWLDHALPDLADRTRTIAYMRPHADHVLSMYSERVKLGATTLAFDDYLKDQVASDELQRIKQWKHWETVFGKNFTVRPMVPGGLYDDDVTRDFLHLLMEGAAFSVGKATPKVNPSLNTANMWFMRTLHARVADSIPDLDPKSRRRLGYSVYDALFRNGHQGPGVRLRYTRAQLKMLQDACAADAKRLDRRFFRNKDSDSRPMSDALHGTDNLTWNDAPPPDPTRPNLHQLRALAKLSPVLLGKTLRTVVRKWSDTV